MTVKVKWIKKWRLATPSILNAFAYPALEAFNWLMRRAWVDDRPTALWPLARIMGTILAYTWFRTRAFLMTVNVELDLLEFIADRPIDAG